MTLARLQTRLKEAKTEAYEAACVARTAAVNASSLKNSMNQGEPRLRADTYVKYEWACTVRDELMDAAAETAKAAQEAQWYVDLVAARETAMFDGEDEI